MYSPTYSYCQVVNRDFALSSKKRLTTLLVTSLKSLRAYLSICTLNNKKRYACFYALLLCIRSVLVKEKRRAGVWDISCGEHMNFTFL